MKLYSRSFSSAPACQKLDRVFWKSWLSVTNLAPASTAPTTAAICDEPATTLSRSTMNR